MKKEAQIRVLTEQLKMDIRSIQLDELTVCLKVVDDSFVFSAQGPRDSRPVFFSYAFDLSFESYRLGIRAVLQEYLCRARMKECSALLAIVDSNKIFNGK